jgi:hypothetical protein
MNLTCQSVVLERGHLFAVIILKANKYPTKEEESRKRE